jgi:hypothetical protein
MRHSGRPQRRQTDAESADMHGESAERDAGLVARRKSRCQRQNSLGGADGEGRRTAAECATRGAISAASSFSLRELRVYRFDLGARGRTRALRAQCALDDVCGLSRELTRFPHELAGVIGEPRAKGAIAE